MKIWFCLIAFVSSALSATECQRSETLHSLSLDDRELNYRVVTGGQDQKDDQGHLLGTVTYISYVSQEKNSKQRPIVFVFNGGPGSCSVWLHLGLVGPRRVALDSFGYPLRPTHLENNPKTLLQVADLVFIDPMSTGRSRLSKDENGKHLYGIDADIRSVGEFIQNYVRTEGRCESPKYLLAESYGAYRAVGLTSHLNSRYNMAVDGIVMISPVLNFQALFEGGESDLAYAAILPSYTTTAWFHGKLSLDLMDDFHETLKKSEELAFGDYALSLIQGDQFDKNKKEELLKELSRLTGLSENFLTKANVRVSPKQFRKELLRNEELVIGDLDGRFVLEDRNDLCDSAKRDPAKEAYFASFAEGINHYLRSELKCTNCNEYRIYVPLDDLWDWGGSIQRTLSVEDKLRESLLNNPNLRLFVAMGYYDMVTPFAANKYVFNHANLSESLKRNITFETYDAGHMMFIEKGSRERLQNDLLEFFNPRQDLADSLETVENLPSQSEESL